MALFKIFKGNSSNLPSEMHDGYCYFTMDDGIFYIDYLDTDGVTLKRKPISGPGKSIEYVPGQQTASTNVWLGTTKDEALYTGKVIAYRLPYDGTTTAATLNLTLGNNTQTGAIAVKRKGSENVTNHYKAGEIIFLTYDGTFWQVNADYHCDSNDTTTGYSRFAYGRFAPTTALYRYQLLLSHPTDSSKVIPLNTTSNNMGTAKTTITTASFNPFEPIYYYSATETVNANALIAVNYLWNAYSQIHIKYSFNTGETLTANKDVYLVAQMQSDGSAKLRNPGATGANASAQATGANAGPISQVLPTSDDGYIYIKLGHAIDAYRVSLTLDHPIYKYSGNNIINTYATKAQIEALDAEITGTPGVGKTLTALSQTDGKVSAIFDDINITKSQISDFDDNDFLSLNIDGFSSAINITPSSSSNVDLNNIITKGNYYFTATSVGSLLNPKKINNLPYAPMVGAGGTPGFLKVFENNSQSYQLLCYSPGFSGKISGIGQEGDFDDTVGVFIRIYDKNSGEWSSWRSFTKNTYANLLGLDFELNTSPENLNNPFFNDLYEEGEFEQFFRNFSESYFNFEQDEENSGAYIPVIAMEFLNNLYKFLIEHEYILENLVLSGYQSEDGYLIYPQHYLDRDPEEDMEIATKQYVDETNTTYTFGNGTNSFTVTPSGGTAQTVTVTPSIANNITGTGTSGYLTKFNGTNTITNGPQLSSAISSQSQTTKFLREDGTWAAPSYTINTDTKVKQTAKTDNVDYKLLTTVSAAPTSGSAAEAGYGANLAYNPSTNTLKTGNASLTGTLNVTSQTTLNDNLNAQGITATNLMVTGNSNFVQIPTAPTAIAGTADTQLATTAFVSNAVSQGFAANDAMVFKGVISSNNELPKNNYSAGWTYRVDTAGTYAGEYCEVGDILIAVNDGPSSGSSVVAVDWAKIEHNIDGAVYMGHSGNSIGSASQPVYVTANGQVTAITGSIANSTTGNAATATTLQNSRTIWGQSFNGSANISGNMINVGNITHTDETQECFLLNKKKENTGGWAYAPLTIKGNDETIFARLAVYGVDDTLHYIYLGANGYSATTNLRIYPDGKVSATKFQGDGSNLTSLNASNLSSGTVSFDRLPSMYWANTAIANTASYNTTPEVASVKISNGTATAAGAKGATLQYDENLEVLNFVFA